MVQYYLVCKMQHKMFSWWISGIFIGFMVFLGCSKGQLFGKRNKTFDVNRKKDYKHHLGRCTSNFCQPLAWGNLFATVMDSWSNHFHYANSRNLIFWWLPSNHQNFLLSLATGNTGTPQQSRDLMASVQLPHNAPGCRCLSENLLEKLFIITNYQERVKNPLL